MNIHDSGCKQLFSNRTFFRDLAPSFVEEDRVERLDFERAERIDKSFVSEHYKESEADLIYRVPLKNPDPAFDGDQAVYIYPLERLLAEANTASTLFIAEAYYDPMLVSEQMMELYDRGDT